MGMFYDGEVEEPWESSVEAPTRSRLVTDKGKEQQ